MPSRRIRIRFPFLGTLCAIVILIASYIFGMSFLQAQWSYLVEPDDLIVPRLIDVVIVVWCFWVGSSIGSFLNVVAWRMPRGESIDGRSHCPRCYTQLKARDNFPVFGWLALGGRCRTCHLPISVRYPIVEGLVGLTLTSVSVAELYRLAIPRQYVHWHGGPFWAPRVDQTILIILIYHVVGLTMCWAFGLIRMDQNALPKRLVAIGLASASIPMMVFPTLMIVPWQMNVPFDWLPVGMYVDAVIRVITALAAATVLGRYLARGFCPAADPKLDPLGKSTKRLVDLIAILVIPIMLVGWQASPALIVLASVIAASIRRWLPRQCDALGSFAISMPFALTFQLVLWRHLHAVDEIRGSVGFPYWPSDGSPPWVMLVWLVLVAMVPLWLRERPTLLTSDTPVPPHHDDEDSLDHWMNEESPNADDGWQDDRDHWQEESRLGETLEFDAGSAGGRAEGETIGHEEDRFDLLHDADEGDGDRWKRGGQNTSFDDDPGEGDSGEEPGFPSKPR